MFAGTGIRIIRAGGSVQEWLFGGRLKKGILTFLAVCLISVFLSDAGANVNSGRALTRLFSYAAVFYSALPWVHSRERIVRVLEVLFVSTIVVDLFGFWQKLSGGYTDLYFWLYPFQEDTLPPWEGRITSLLFQPNALAGYLNLVLPLAIACMFVAREQKLKRLAFVCTVATAVAVALSGSRGGIIGLGAVLLSVGWLLSANWATRLKMLLSIFLVCVLLIVPILGGVQRSRGSEDDLDNSRLGLWGAAVVLFLSHPTLGVGYGNYRELFSTIVPGSTPEAVDAHNIYLEFLADTGVTGFVAFLTMIGIALHGLGKIGRGANEVSRIVSIGATAAIISMLLHGCVDYLFNVNPQFGDLFYLILALGVSAQSIALTPLVWNIGESKSSGNPEVLSRTTPELGR